MPRGPGWDLWNSGKELVHWEWNELEGCGDYDDETHPMLWHEATDLHIDLHEIRRNDQVLSFLVTVANDKDISPEALEEAVKFLHGLCWFTSRDEPTMPPQEEQKAS